MPQPCAVNYEWNSFTCACQCADTECSLGEFFDPSSCQCRCYYPDIVTEGSYFDMKDCTEKLIPDCSVEGENYYWDEVNEQCLCVFKAPYVDQVTNRPMTWNRDSCSYDCVPETCIDDTYYWDAVQCKCACYEQTCPDNHTW